MTTTLLLPKAESFQSRTSYISIPIASSIDSHHRHSAMVSLWGSKNGEEHPEGGEGEHNGEDSRQSQRHSGGAEPDERTRLLPPRSDGFLDPDDPAVSTLAASVPDDVTNVMRRSHHTIFGASGHSIISASSSWSSASCGGSYYSSPSSSAHPRCTPAALASSTSPTQH